MPRAILLLILSVSLAANIWFVTEARHGDARITEVRTAPRPAAPPPNATSGPAFRWTEADLATDGGLRTLRTNLEAIGLPADVMRGALVIAIHRSYQKRRAALLGQPKPNQYWRNRGVEPDPATLAAVRELERAQRKLARELVGEDFDFDEDSTERRYGGLPPEKIAKLQRIFADYSDLEEQMFSEGNERSSPEIRAKAELLAREKRADIERLLSPQELLEYDLRNHPAAHRLRSRLGPYEVTEAEFVALYPAFKSALAEGDSRPRPGRSNAEMRRAQEATEARLDAELRRVLGEARFAELKDANDHLLRETRAFISSLQLPPAAADEIVAIQKEFSAKLGAVDRDRDLTPNQRDAKSSALGLEARDRLTQILGPANFETYKRRGGGWLGAALARGPPTPSPAP